MILPPLGLIICFASVGVFALVLFGQIIRIDRLENRIWQYARNQVINENEQWHQVQAIAREVERITRNDAAVQRCHLSEFVPGEQHPFAPDAYVSTTDVVM